MKSANLEDIKMIKKLIQDVELLEKKHLLKSSEFHEVNGEELPQVHSNYLRNSKNSEILTNRIKRSSQNDSYILEKLIKTHEAHFKIIPGGNHRSLTANGAETSITYSSRTEIVQVQNPVQLPRRNMFAGNFGDARIQANN